MARMSPLQMNILNIRLFPSALDATTSRRGCHGAHKENDLSTTQWMVFTLYESLLLLMEKLIIFP